MTNRGGIVVGIIDLAQEVGHDLQKDADGKVRLTLPELVVILEKLGILIVDAVVVKKSG